EDFARRLRLLEVTERGDVRSARQDLAVRGDPQLDAWQGLADGTELEAIGPVEREGRTRLGEPVALQEEDAGGVEELGDVTRERGATGHGPLEPPAQGGMELREHQRVGELPFELERRGHGLAALLMAAHVPSDRHRPAEDPLLRGRAGLDAGQDLAVDLLEHTRHAADEVWPRLPQVFADLVQVLRKRRRQAVRHAEKRLEPSK